MLGLKILAVDTALGACSAAVLEGERVRAAAFVEMARGHAEALAPMVAAIMNDADLGFAELDRLAVTTGPGTFTGQRVGLAFARGLALALEIPLIGVTTLDAMLEEILTGTPARWAAVVHDAKRGEGYFGARAAGIVAPCGPVLLPMDQIPSCLRGLAEIHGPHLALGGTAAEMLTPKLRANGLQVETSPVRQPNAIYVAQLGSTADPVSHPPKPLYLREADAKLPAARPQ